MINTAFTSWTTGHFPYSDQIFSNEIFRTFIWIAFAGLSMKLY